MYEIDDYLYEENITANEHVPEIKQLFSKPESNQFSDKKSLYHFDQLNLVIIDVPGNILPWQQKSHKLT